MKERRQVSDICADSAPAAVLSNDPDSMVPGRDYPTTRLQPVMRWRWWRGVGRLRVWVVIKWKGVLTVIRRGG